eukprot:186245_1
MSKRQKKQKNVTDTKSSILICGLQFVKMPKNKPSARKSAIFVLTFKTFQYKWQIKKSFDQIWKFIEYAHKSYGGRKQILYNVVNNIQKLNIDYIKKGNSNQF